MPLAAKETQRRRRHRRVRKKVVGTAQRPRLVVHRSHLHLEAQVIDDLAGRTLLGRSTRGKAFGRKPGGNVEAARILGGQVAEAVVQQGIRKLAFDRGGYPYHGRIRALVEAVRSQGVEI